MAIATNPIEAARAREGEDFGAGDWLEVTQERINQFADATSDHQWIHVDLERAEEGPFGKPIAQGFLTLSLIVPLTRGIGPRPEGFGMGINYGLNRVRFPAPVRVGSKIRARLKNLSIEEVPGPGVQIVNEITVEIEGQDKPACVAEHVLRLYV